MKPLFTLLILCCCSIYASAQNKIVITYDENGNRIQRELICPGCRPADTSTEENTGVRAGNAISDMQARPGVEAAGRFAVYPNPAGNSVNLRLDALSLKEKCLVVLSDVLGKEHYRKKVTTAVTTIPLHRLADGVYFLTLFRGLQKDVVKIVRETGAGHP